jgi:hypothetical protein
MFTQNYWDAGLYQIIWYFKELENTTFWKLDVSVLRWGRETPTLVQWLRLALSKEPNTVVVSPSSEDGNNSSFWNVVFSSFSKYWTMDEVWKLSNSEHYTPSSEPFRIYMFTQTCHCSLFWLSWIQSTPSDTISLLSILMLSSTFWDMTSCSSSQPLPCEP